MSTIINISHTTNVSPFGHGGENDINNHLTATAGAAFVGAYSLNIEYTEDGVSMETITATNNLLKLYYPSIGATCQPYTVSGTFYMDYWCANDDGSQIEP